jgi:hypothetical protein
MVNWRKDKTMIIPSIDMVPCGIDVDFNSATDNLCDSINMKGSHGVIYAIQLVDIGTASPLLLVYSGATNAATTSALPFYYRFGGAAAGSANCDVFGEWTACEATGLTLTHGTYDDYLLQVFVDAAQMDTANGEEWLTLDFQDTGDAGATGQATVIALLVKNRYQAGSAPTVIA